ncbi:MAG: cobalamin B12-binding domain-containing protein, partial [Rhodospirillaceae bacterium]|nr:cobalamin B12-binding domain-containing protein [Rhodospirillales bacterium]
SGMPKMKIEEAAARRQARIDRGDEVVVGVNKYQPKEDTVIEILDVDNAAVRESQVARLKQIKATRDAAKVEAALAALTEAGVSGKGNLLELSVIATRARATVGEISDALEVAFTRHKAVIHSISGVYGGVYQGDAGFDKLKADVDAFAKTEGRRPRMLVCKMGQDGHDRGAKVIATAFADIGFDVDVGPLFQTPEEAARQAVENDVHIVAASSLAAGHKTLVPTLIDELKKQGAGDILVVTGGVIPQQDYDMLYKAGVAAVYGPGTNIPKAAAEILELLKKRK